MKTETKPASPVRIKRIGNSVYRISNTKKDPSKGKWYIHEYYNDGKRWLSGETVHYHVLQTAIDVFEGITKEMEIVIHKLCKAEQERIREKQSTSLSEESTT